MYEGMRIRYLFFDLDYRSYLVLQTAVICAWGVAAVLFYLFGRGSEAWLWDNAWWICVLVAALELQASIMAVSKAKKALGDGGGRGTK